MSRKNTSVRAIGKTRLTAAIRQATDEGYVTFISGMARGVGIWVAQIVLQVRSKNQKIHLVAAVPYKGFESRWTQQWQEQYNFILKCVDLVKYICGSTAWHRSKSEMSSWLTTVIVSSQFITKKPEENEIPLNR